MTVPGLGMTLYTDYFRRPFHYHDHTICSKDDENEFTKLWPGVHTFIDTSLGSTQTTI